MTRLPSLRARVFVGAVLWSLGLLVVSAAAVAALFEYSYVTARAVHRALGHTSIVVGISLMLLAAGFARVRRGLSPLARLRERLGAVHSGESTRVDGAYPSEVQPLVDDLNALLDHRDRLVQRAQAKAGDLAHGLKTPLAVLAQEAERARDDGHTEFAASLSQQVDRMRRQIDYHLAQARAAAAGGGDTVVRSAIADSASALAQTLLRLHAERGVTIDTRVPDGLAVRCQREDLDEMLGNLMDNACKWARSRVTVSALASSGTVAVVVEDDGPGLDPTRQAEVLRRGVRLDEAVPGTGLGLAIASELAELYGGSLSLDRSPMGGLAARLVLPAPS